MSDGHPLPPASVPLVPDYAGPVTPRATRTLPYLKIAACCGALPLTVGSAVFVLWLATRYDPLRAVGLFTILGGLLLFLVGAICLVLETGRSVRPTDRGGRRWKRAGTALFLLANFPAAALIVGAATEIQSRVTVTVQNNGTATIDSFVVTAPGSAKQLGPIPPGATRQVRLRPNADGSVDYAMKQGGHESAGTLIGYVSSGMGGRCTAVVNGESVSVR